VDRIVGNPAGIYLLPLLRNLVKASAVAYLPNKCSRLNRCSKCIV
jgi:hypothetical protein